MRKRHTVVGSHHHDCVFEQSALFQVCQHAAQMQIEIFHLQRVIEHVVAHFLGIRPACGHAVNVGGLLAALGHTGAIFVAAMRLVAAIPEGPRLPRGNSIKKITKISRVIGCRHSFGRLGRKFLFIKGLASHLTVFAGGVLGNTRPPALAGHSDKVTLLTQRLLVGFELRRKNGPVIASLPELPRVAAGDDTRARRRTFAVWRVGLREKDAVAGHAIHGRRLDPFAAVNSRMTKRPIVRNRKENVGFCWGLLPFSGRQKNRTSHKNSSQYNKSDFYLKIHF